jgi:hypothetical protein
MVLHPRSGYLHLRFMRRLRETQTLKAGGARRAPAVLMVRETPFGSKVSLEPGGLRRFFLA